MTKKYLNELTYEVIGCCINVHKEIGPGLLESVYHRCLEEEFYHNGINFQSELSVPIQYRERDLDARLRLDFLIDECLALEIKSVESMIPIFDAQTMTYMRLLEVPKGLLVNFNSTNIFKYGQKTIVNEYFRNLPD